MTYTHSCGTSAPPSGATASAARCGRPADHRGVHVAYGPTGREMDTWPRFEDVIALKQENGTL